MRLPFPAALLGSLLACQLIWIGLFAAGLPSEHENGPMENFQAVCLGLGAVLLVWVSLQTPVRAARLFFLALALFFVSFLVREIEVEDWNIPRVLVYALEGKPRNIWVGTLWLVLFILLLQQARAVWETFLFWIKTPAGRLLIAGGVAYALSWPLDKSLANLPRATELFLEELADTTATLLMLLSAISTIRSVRRAATENRAVDSNSANPTPQPVHETKRSQL